MRFFPRGVLMLVLGFGLIAPIYARAQSNEGTASRTAASALNEQLRTGRRLFSQNCFLCHAPEKKNPKSTVDEGTTIGPRLNGLFKGPKPLSDMVAKTFILRGVEGKMPGFQYGLEPSEIDAIIAYLKTL